MCGWAYYQEACVGGLMMRYPIPIPCAIPRLWDDVAWADQYPAAEAAIVLLGCSFVSFKSDAAGSEAAQQKMTTMI